MIEFLVNLQIDTESDALVEAAMPALRKYNCIDVAYDSEWGKSGLERLHIIVENMNKSKNLGVMVFEAKCIEENESYSDLAVKIFRHAGKVEKIRKLKSVFSHKKNQAGLAVLIEGSPEKKVWNQFDDWISQDFISFMDHILEKNFSKRILSLTTSYEFFCIMVIDSENHPPLDKLINFSIFGYSPRKLYHARLISTLLTSVCGVVLSSIIGLLFVGFLWSFLVSVGIWSLITIGLVLKYAWACVQEEEAEELSQAAPEASGNAVAASFVEEAAKRLGVSKMIKRLKKVVELNRSWQMHAK